MSAEDYQGYKDLKKLKQSKCSNNRHKSTELLVNYNINFTSHNFGAHLVINHNGELIDFWPGTGKWCVRRGKEGRGVFKLLKLLNITVNKRGK